MTPKTHPCYDVATGAITGCLPGSLAYRHELRHAEQETVLGLCSLAAKLEMPLLTIALATPVIPGAYTALVAYVAYRLVLELDAEAYARTSFQLFNLRK